MSINLRTVEQLPHYHFGMEASSHFKCELDLVRTFNSFLNNAGLSSQARVALEFDAGHGVADIVIFGVHENSRSDAIEFSQIPPRYAVVFGSQSLPRIFSVQQFSELTGAGINVSVRLLNLLAKQGVLQRMPDSRYERVVEYANPINTIVSIEAKLRDWRRALRQAYRYREFSNQSWVLMDAARVSSALEQINLFIRSGVGLASISTSGNLYIHHEPPVTNPFSESRYWAASIQLANQYLEIL